MHAPLRLVVSAMVLVSALFGCDAAPASKTSPTPAEAPSEPSEREPVESEPTKVGGKPDLRGVKPRAETFESAGDAANSPTSSKAPPGDNGAASPTNSFGEFGRRGALGTGGHENLGIAGVPMGSDGSMAGAEDAQPRQFGRPRSADE